MELASLPDMSQCTDTHASPVDLCLRLRQILSHPHVSFYLIIMLIFDNCSTKIFLTFFQSLIDAQFFISSSC